MTQYTVLRSTQVIVPSHSTARDLSTRLGAPVRKLRVIPLGVDERYFSPAAPEIITEVRRRYGLEKPFVLFVGERRPHKNLEGLLQAFDIFRRRATLDYHLVIAGRPYSGYHEPKTLAEELGLSDCVHFISDVADFYLPFLYRAADGMALLSHYEGFGLPVLEALACGTPVLVSNTTSLPEVAGEAGLQVSPSDAEQAAEALLQLVTPSSDQQQRIALGIEHARGFTWERCARQTLEVYREALAV